MLTHAKDQDFATKAKLYSWACNNWEIEIVHKSSIISNMKPAGTKNSSLCMQERIVLFKAFHQKRTSTHNFMNSKNEMYDMGNAAAERDSYGYLPLGMRVLMRL